MTDLEKDLAAILNRHSAEQSSNTPDFILAMYLRQCLAAFSIAVRQRETWYGRDARPNMTKDGLDEPDPRDYERDPINFPENIR